MDIEQKRKLARDILEDEMSDNTLEHISKIDYLQDWIIDAMINFSNKVNNCALDDVSVRFLFDFVNEFTDTVIPIEAIEENFKRLNEH
jgi:hypothetical protein